jgi:hypothetical protein
VKQGVDNAAQRLQQEGKKTSLLSGRSQRAVSEANRKSRRPRNPPPKCAGASNRRTRLVTLPTR